MCFIQVQAKINELHWKQSTQQMSEYEEMSEHEEMRMRAPKFSALETSYGQNWRSNKQNNEVESMNYVEQAITLIETVFQSIQMQEKVDHKLQDKMNKRLSKQLTKLLVCAVFWPHPHTYCLLWSCAAQASAHQFLIKNIRMDLRTFAVSHRLAPKSVTRSHMQSKLISKEKKSCTRTLTV